MKYSATFLLLLLLLLISGCGRKSDPDQADQENIPPTPAALSAETPIPSPTPTETETPAIIQPATGTIVSVSRLAEPRNETPMIPAVNETIYTATAMTIDRTLLAETAYAAVDNASHDFYFRKNRKHEPAGTDAKYPEMFKETDAFYLGDTRCKCLYLTFDAGYENGFTGLILDRLKEHSIRAAFFLTGDYIQSSSELVLRMVNEGHIVGNHTQEHATLPDLTDEEVIEEITGLAGRFKELTEKEMHYFRPPMGTFSLRTLKIAEDLGYKTAFWSWAFADWETTAKVPKETIRKNFAENLHPGEIVLMHAVSQTNVNTLDIILEVAKKEGYEFRSLDEIHHGVTEGTENLPEIHGNERK